MSSYDCHSDYDDAEDGRRQLEEYELYVYEQRLKARGLYLYDEALDVSDPAVEELVSLVQQYAVPHSDWTLGDVLRDTVAELLISNELPDGVTAQPLSREGYIPLRSVVHQACDDFEELLAAKGFM